MAYFPVFCCLYMLDNSLKIFVQILGPCSSLYFNVFFTELCKENFNFIEMILFQTFNTLMHV